MAHREWIKTVTITPNDLAEGDWNSRDKNPIALALARVLRPGIILFVDPEEYYLRFGIHWGWYCLPDALVEYSSRVIHDSYQDGITLQMYFEHWALETKRSSRNVSKAEEPQASPDNP